jgi:uncharacterized Ntn-hydrolase superfamily protein
MTYSMVARDPSTGQLGVAVQSHYFSVGSIVSWAEPGVGAVATQSFAEPSYGPQGLDLIRSGRSAAGALGELIDKDSGEATRQVAMIDNAGRVAVHTGRSCIAEAGHQVGDQVSAQANMMRRDTVWHAMIDAYSATPQGDLATRLLAALDAAEAEGGDIRGRQSAAIVVVSGRRSERPWEQRLVELRVEDHPDPLPELRRLLELKRAYDRVEKAEQLTLSGDLKGALEQYELASASAPDNLEFTFWRGVTLAASGRIDEAQPLLERVYTAHDGWAELLRRLQAVGLLPDDPELMRSLLPG